MLFSICSSLDAIWEIIVTSLSIVLLSLSGSLDFAFPLDVSLLIFFSFPIGIESLDRIEELNIDIDVSLFVSDFLGCTFDGPAFVKSSCVFGVGCDENSFKEEFSQLEP